MASSSSPQKSLIASSPRHPLLACHSDEDSGCVMDDIYAWVPPRTNPELVHSFFAALPPDKVPRIGTPGEQWRTRQLVRQQPPQDADARFCGNLSAQEERELAAFARSRAQHDQGRGHVQWVSVEVAKLYCHQCKLPIGGGAEAAVVAVGAPRHFGALALWHPRCFVCVECQHLLADLAYFVHAQNIFCGRHHAELSKPRCASCDELIFSAECTEAEGRVWHMKHFCCERCGESLGGKRYVMNSKDAQPMCVPCCRDAVQQMRCDTCAKQIDADRPHIAQGSFRWHADQRCFCCSVCARALLGKPYSLLSNGRLFCGAQGCARKPEVPSASPLVSPSPLPPPSFPPPPPPRCSPSLRGVRFNMALMDSALPPPSLATPSVENVYETVAPFPATVSAPSASTSGCSANGSILSSASSSGAANASPHYYQLRRGRTAAAEDAEETRRRCRSADGRAERRRRKSKKQKRPMRNAPALVAPPAGSSLAAALALATSGRDGGRKRRRRQKRSRRRQRRRERRRRERILYGESSSSSDSEDDEDSTFSSASSSASSYSSSSSSSSSSSDDDDALGVRGRRDATAALLREYCMRTALNARVNGGRTQLMPGSPVTPASSSAGTPSMASGGKTRMARMRSTTAKKTQPNSGNCRIS